MSRVESYIQVPPEGGGRRIRTIQRRAAGFDVQEEMLVLQANARALLPLYSVCAIGLAHAADRHLLSIYNQPLSNRWLEVLMVRVAAAGISALGYALAFRVRRTTSDFTPGTVLTPAKFNTLSPDLPTQIYLQTNAPPATVLSTVAALSLQQNPDAFNNQATLVFEQMGVPPVLIKEGEGITIQQYNIAGYSDQTTLHVYCVFRSRLKG